MDIVVPQESTEVLKPRALFGGAMGVALPARFADASVFRQVPDTQEVFVDGATDQSVIVELLELAGEVAAPQAAEFHFGSLAQDNAAREAAVQQQFAPVAIEHGGLRTMCVGTQTVAKFNEGAAAANRVLVCVAVFRLPHVTTDIVLSYNAVETISGQSSSAHVVDAQQLAGMTPQKTLALFTRIVDTLTVNDYGLFVA